MAAGVAAALTAATTVVVAGLGLPPFSRIAHVVEPPAVLASGPIRLESEPSGALVRLDGIDKGITPLVLPSLSPGRYAVQLLRVNYEDWSGDVQISAGTPLTQRIRLIPIESHLYVDSSVDGAVLWADGVRVSPLPVSLDLLPGPHLLRLEAPGYDAWQESVPFAPHESRSFFLTTSGADLNLVPEDPSRPLAVVIDNLNEARPQTGLDRADVVYEALVEGGITRFLAVFLTQDADVVGPVRSARHYFVPWANEYQAPLVHIGASPQGFAALAASPIADLNSVTTWRDSGRLSPHNAYTSTAASLGALRRRPVGSFGGLHFKLDEKPKVGTEASELTIAYNGAYSVGWTYDAERNDYVRSINGRPHRDRDTGEQLRATNVLVLRMQSYLIAGDPLGRLNFAQTGSGSLSAFLDGVQVDGRWTRSSLTGVTRYLDSEGHPLELNSGNVWIQIVPPEARLDVVKES